MPLLTPPFQKSQVPGNHTDSMQYFQVLTQNNYKDKMFCLHSDFALCMPCCVSVLKRIEVKDSQATSILKCQQTQFLSIQVFFNQLNTHQNHKDTRAYMWTFKPIVILHILFRNYSHTSFHSSLLEAAKCISQINYQEAILPTRGTFKTAIVLIVNRRYFSEQNINVEICHTQ